MSRNSRRSNKKGSKAASTGPPPSHPLEVTSHEHRHFLVRSLERNDVEVAALVELNDSLRKAKKKILESCGELVLLDLGSGRLRLVGDNNELHEDVTGGGGNNNSNARQQEEEHHALTPAQKEVCVDFLLRMKLRRKLSNRLVRRLNRVAHAMDGKDVAPPFPPRYGDLRLNMDPAAVEARVKEWKEQADAKLRIEAALAGRPLPEQTAAAVAATANEAGGANYKTEEMKHDESPRDGAQADRPKEECQDGMATAVKKEGEVTPMEVDGENKEEDKPQDGKAGDTKEGCSSPPIPKPSATTLEEDYAILKEYDTAYEKTWDPDNKRFKYVLAEESSNTNQEPEYAQFKQGVGIGATARLMSLEDREAEHKRWQNNILNCIPEQPTFEELGLKNRVFFLEERRKRCLEETSEIEEDDIDCNEMDGTPRSSASKKLKTPEDGSSLKVSPVKRTNGKELRKKVAFEGEGDSMDGTSDEVAIEKEKAGSPLKDKVERKVEEEFEIKRHISLKPVPSFYAQDMKRIKDVHRDLLEHTIMAEASSRIRDATNEYNNALQVSAHVFNNRQRLQSSVTFAIAKGRQEVQESMNRHMAVVEQAKQRWMKDKRAHDVQRAQSVLPSKWGRPMEGTEKIKTYIHEKADPVSQQVGHCLGDVVDGCVALSEGKVLMKKFDDFVPPDDPTKDPQTDETAKERQVRMELEYKNQYNAANTRFQECEVERTRAWRKLMQTKASVEAPVEIYTGVYNRRARVTQNNHHQFPVPALTQSRRESVPESISRHAASLATYTPPVERPESASKYSAARVRERIAADGTVAPVNEAKRDKDGFYLRPAGRTRKGMQWDAVNGLWVPEAESN